MDKAPRVLLARSLIGGAIWALGGFMSSYFFLVLGIINGSRNC